MQNPKQRSASVIQSTCAYCGVGCGVDINIEQGRANSLCGSREHPANFGRLCVKGTHLLDTVDLSGRLLYPELYGKRVSWQQATSEVAARFKHFIETYGKESVAFYVSGQLLTEDYYVANKLMKGYIGTANIDTNSRLCMSSAVSAYKRAFGEDVVPCDYQDIEQTDLLILIGSNIAWTHPVLFQRLERARAVNPDLKVVAIDPRATASTSVADLHLAIKPGSDAALYCGLLHFLHQNHGIDNVFVKGSTDGLAQTLKSVEQWSVDKVAEFCGLNKQQVNKFYQLFLTQEKVVSFYSMGINQSSTGVDKCNAIINVHLASGKIAKAGCGPFSITGQPNAMGGREVGALANQLTAHLDIENDQHRELVQRYWQSPTMCQTPGLKAVDLFNAIEQGQIKAVWIMATNPVVSLPNRNHIEKALRQCELVVVSDCVASNDTLAFADIKLPATPWAEKDGMVTNSERRMSRQRAFMPASGEAKPDWKIVCEVAQKMGFSGFDFEEPRAVFNEFATLTGINNHGSRVLDISPIGALSITDYAKLSPLSWPFKAQAHRQGDGLVSYKPFTDGRFSTANGKAQIIPIVPKLPKSSVNREYPFLLNSGRIRDQWHTMTRTAKAAALNQHTAKPTIDIHPLDAKRLSIVNEQIVTVTSKVGQLSVLANVSVHVAQGQCFMPIHWSESFTANTSVMKLYPSVVDTLSGQPESKQVAIAIQGSHYPYYGEIYVKNQLITPLTLDFWLTTKLTHSHFYQCASNGAVESLEQQLKAHINVTGEWLSFKAPKTETYYFVAIEQQQLAAVIYISPQQISGVKHWVDELFKETILPFEAIKSLLYQQEQVMTKQVCSCYNVNDVDIIAAIENGATSVSGLGKKLRCGTQCGSCKPELSTLIAQHAADKGQIIDLISA